MTNTSENFARNISNLIEEKGVQSRQLSKDTGISLGTISNYRNGCAEAGISNAVKLAEYFGVSVDWLTGMEPDCRKPNADFRGVHEYLGLSENALTYLHNIKDSNEATALSMLLESKSFKIFLIKIYTAIMNKADIVVQLYELGLIWNIDDIIMKVNEENAEQLDLMLLRTQNQEQDGQYLLYELSQIYSELIDELLEPFPRAKLKQLASVIDSSL